MKHFSLILFFFLICNANSRPIVNNIDKLSNDIKTILQESDWADVAMVHGDNKKREKNIFIWSGTLKN